MKQLIKSATVYKAIIPVGADALHDHLETRPFSELLPTQMLGRGFVPINVGGRMVSTFTPSRASFSASICTRCASLAAS